MDPNILRGQPALIFGAETHAVYMNLFFRLMSYQATSLKLFYFFQTSPKSHLIKRICAKSFNIFLIFFKRQCNT